WRLACKGKKATGSGFVLGQPAATALVELAKRALCRGETLFGGEAIKPRSLALVGLQPVAAILIRVAESILRMGVALLGGKSVEPGSFGWVLRQPAAAIFIVDRQIVLSSLIPLI